MVRERKYPLPITEQSYRKQVHARVVIHSLGSFQIPRIVQGDTIEHRTRTKCVSSDSQLQPHTIRVLTACRASMLCSYREWISLARLILYAVSLCSREIDPRMTEVIHTNMIICVQYVFQIFWQERKV